MPHPSISYEFKNGSYFVEIPLLCTGAFKEILTQDIKVTDGKLSIEKFQDSEFDDIKAVLEVKNYISNSDIDVMVYLYTQSFKLVSPSFGVSRNNIAKIFTRSFNFSTMPTEDTHHALTDLEDYGCTIIMPDVENELSWESLVGYEKVKQEIEDTILFSMTHPEIFKKISEETRIKFEDNRPKFVLFEGPPGCGKTTSAKIISQTVDVPLIYMPLEAILSKFYGESETKLSKIFEICQDFPQCILFIDEIDALGISRESNIHEATRRVLSTLLRKLDSFEAKSNVLVI